MGGHRIQTLVIGSRSRACHTEGG